MSNAHTRIVFAGVNEGGNDWSVGLSTIGDETAGLSDWQTWIDAHAADMANTFNGTGTGFWGELASVGDSLQKISAYTYPAGAPPARVVAEHVLSPVKNGRGGHAGPYTSACCVTLRTTYAGRSGRGRFYAPADGAALTTHQFDDTALLSVAEGVARLIGVINAAPAPSGTGNLTVVVASSVLASPNPVTSVRADSLPDVQRRRQDKVAAATSHSVNV